MSSMKIVQFSRLPTLLVELCPKFFHLLDLGRSVSNNLPPRPSPNDNQSIKRKHNPRMTIICYQVRSFLQVGFCFQYQLSNLSGFLLTSFHLALANLCPQSYFKKLRTSFLPSSYSKKMCWGQGGAEASLSAFSLLCFFVCAVVQKYYKIFFIYNYSHF